METKTDIGENKYIKYVNGAQTCGVKIRTMISNTFEQQGNSNLTATDAPPPHTPPAGGFGV